ncbi:MAG: hypothetical protein PHC41_04350 [Lachnospiraceae bacterium]|nr:hypothetical protein [Lachnospiraceae bacterium]MDD3615438.1 hypothetical protein [Lachnospiraceae bacterium]
MMKKTVEVLKRAWESMKYYIEISAQVNVLYPHHSCTGFMGYYPSPVAIPIDEKVFRKLQ